MVFSISLCVSWKAELQDRADVGDCDCDCDCEKVSLSEAG
jgi:hypothetical protein